MSLAEGKALRSYRSTALTTLPDPLGSANMSVPTLKVVAVLVRGGTTAATTTNTRAVASRIPVSVVVLVAVACSKEVAFTTIIKEE